MNTLHTEQDCKFSFLSQRAALSQVLNVDIQESLLNSMGIREKKVQPRILFKEKRKGLGGEREGKKKKRKPLISNGKNKVYTTKLKLVT